MAYRGRSNVADYEFEWRGETAHAIKVFDGDEIYWLPKSQIEYEEGEGTVTVTIPDWLAREKGIA